jgi:hypothetical protein
MKVDEAKIHVEFLDNEIQLSYIVNPNTGAFVVECSKEFRKSAWPDFMKELEDFKKYFVGGIEEASENGDIDAFGYPWK